MTEPRKLRVFLCHSSQDKPIVRELYQRLLAEEWIDPWLDEEKLLPGQDWDMAIEKAVEATDAVFVCLSNNSVNKEGYVQRELKFVLDIALEKNDNSIFIVPIRLDDCQVPRRIRTWQFVDYFPKNRRKWAFTRLQESLRTRAVELELISLGKVKVSTYEVISVTNAQLSVDEDRKTQMQPFDKKERKIAVVQAEDFNSQNQTLKKNYWEDQLDNMIGLEPVRQKMMQLQAYLQDQKERFEHGLIDKRETKPSLHLVFLGNPGTGKTTVARLIGEMYRDLGLLKKGHVVSVEYRDLISEHVGGTVSKTDEQVDKALDGVLFIDEAYQLAEQDRGGFGQEAIDRLITRMENERERLVVIVAGYPGRMKKFLQSNPGMTSRFSLDNQITFPDYKPAELMRILRGFFDGKGLVGSEAFNRSVQEVVENLYHERDEETFGNARKMRELADSVEVMRASRRVDLRLPLDALMEPEDISPAYQRYLLPDTPKMDNLLAELNSLVGLEEVKEMVSDLVYRLRANKRRMELGQKTEKQRLNMLFVGNPGTGKTTVARMLGKIFQAVGLLRSGHVHEIRAGDLIAGYLGQTEGKAREVMKEALDGVLFIDEAYQLTPGGASDTFKIEAIGSLMRYIDQYPDRLVVIMAGYPKEMTDLIGSNPGLPRRFTQTMVFVDYSDDDLLEILRRKAENIGVHLSPGVLPLARDYFQNIRKTSGNSFGNAGVVDILIGQMQGSQSRRLDNTKDDQALKTFEPEDILGSQSADLLPKNSQ